MYVVNRPWAQAYVEQLLCPQDWFSFWRLNCRLASYHALVTGSKGYGQEDKVRSTAESIVKNHKLSTWTESVGGVTPDTLRRTAT